MPDPVNKPAVGTNATAINEELEQLNTATGHTREELASMVEKTSPVKNIAIVTNKSHIDEAVEASCKGLFNCWTSADKNLRKYVLADKLDQFRSIPNTTSDRDDYCVVEAGNWDKGEIVKDHTAELNGPIANSSPAHTDFAVKSSMYHEGAHCDPKSENSIGTENQQAQFTEVFADSKAAFQLIKDGVREGKLKIAQEILRGKAARRDEVQRKWEGIDSEYDTGDAIRAILEIDPKEIELMSSEQMSERAELIAKNTVSRKNYALKLP